LFSLGAFFEQRDKSMTFHVFFKSQFGTENTLALKIVRITQARPNNETTRRTRQTMGLMSNNVVHSKTTLSYALPCIRDNAPFHTFPVSIPW
jgi:hypothetical protein